MDSNQFNSLLKAFENINSNGISTFTSLILGGFITLGSTILFDLYRSHKGKKEIKNKIIIKELEIRGQIKFLEKWCSSGDRKLSSKTCQNIVENIDQIINYKFKINQTVDNGLINAKEKLLNLSQNLMNDHEIVILSYSERKINEIKKLIFKY